MGSMPPAGLEVGAFRAPTLVHHLVGICVGATRDDCDQCAAQFDERQTEPLADRGGAISIRDRVELQHTDDHVRAEL